MRIEQKINYLEKKFNAPMDIIMQAIRECKSQCIEVTEIELKKA